SGPAVAETARAAERAGFDAVAVTDHPFPHDEWMRSGGHHALDPFVALSFAAAATARIRLLTFIYVLPYRNPFLSAKAAASLDVLSGGRFVFGVAAGYLEPEFAALGVPFAERDALADEAIRAMQAAWGGTTVHFEGKHIAARGLGAFGTPHFDPEAFLADVAELCAAGVTYLNVNLPAASRAEHVERIARFGDQVLARLP